MTRYSKRKNAINKYLMISFPISVFSIDEIDIVGVDKIDKIKELKTEVRQDHTSLQPYGTVSESSPITASARFSLHRNDN